MLIHRKRVADLTITLMFLTALFLGMRHALEPDHMVAVATLAAEERRLWPAARLGLIWGLGHQVPLTLLGIVLLLLRVQLPESVEQMIDLAVGLILVALGTRTIWHLRKGHWHRHGHGADRHRHATPGHHRQGLLTFGIGLVHGLGGSGAIVVLALATAPTIGSGIGYLLAFGTGVCIGMFALTLCVVAPTLSVIARHDLLHNTVRAVAGAAATGLGIMMWFEILPQLLGA